MMVVEDNIKIQLEYDDNALEIMDKVNSALRSFGLYFEPDNQYHDGFEIFELKNKSTM